MGTGQEVNSFKSPFKMKSSDQLYEPELPAETDLSDDNYIFVARVIDKNGKEMCRECYFAGKWKHTGLEQAIIGKNISVQTDGSFLTLTSDKLALYVTLTHPELTFADNALILLPKEKISVRIIGHELLQSRVEEIDILMLNQFLLQQ